MMRRIVLSLFLILLNFSCAQKQSTKSYQMEQREPASRTSVSELLSEEERINALKNLKGFYDNASAEIIPAIAMIEGARKTIDIEIYEMSDKDFRAALRRALARKVIIRIVKDPTPLGTDCFYFKQASAEKPDSEECLDQKALVNEINQSGGQVVPFVKSELCDLDETDPSQIKANCYEHGKMIISDNKTALISTGNFNSSNLCNVKEFSSTCNRDFSYVTHEKRALKIFRKVFENDLLQKRYNIQAILNNDGKTADNITVSPFSLEPILQFIKSAKKSIEIENQYLKHPAMNQALIEAAKVKGMKIKVMVASLCSFSKPNAVAKENARLLFSPFDEAGIATKIFTRNIKVEGHPGYLHAKAIIVDGKKAWIGSVNGSKSALEVNREFGIFFSGKDVKKLREILNSDFSSEGAETWQESLECLKD